MQPSVAQFAGPLNRSPRRDAAGQPILHFEQQNAIVFSRQASKFAVEGLEAEIDGDIGLVVPEKLAYRFHIFREAGCADDKLRVKWVQKPKIPFSN